MSSKTWKIKETYQQKKQTFIVLECNGPFTQFFAWDQAQNMIFIENFLKIMGVKTLKASIGMEVERIEDRSGSTIGIKKGEMKLMVNDPKKGYKLERA
ncbi:MAG: hypothetical protein V4439_02710 [Patescibacteria group bacterium]